MTAYREIVRDEQDTQRIVQMIRELKTDVEVIIVPLESRNDTKMLINTQGSVVARVWDNETDKIAGCFKEYAKPGVSFKEEREVAWASAMRDKYGLD